MTWDVPSSVADEIGHAADQAAVIDAITRRPGGLSAKRQRAVMHPAGAVAALLIAPRTGQRALVLGVENVTLPVAVAGLGATVTCADWNGQRLHFGRLMGEPNMQGTWRELATDTALPFDDASFDVVITDLDEVEAAFGSVRTALADIARVLAPGGRLVLSVPNQLRRGRSHGVGGMPRAIRSPWAGDTLAATGFAHQRVIVPYPSRATWKWLIPLERLREPIGDHEAVVDRRTGLIRLWKALARLGLGRWITEDVFVVAAGGADGELPIVPDTLEAVAGEPSPRLRSLSDARVAVIGQRRFAKIPLSPFQQQALVGELRNTELAAQTAFAPYVLTGGQQREHLGVAVTDFPLVNAASDGTTNAQATVLAILSEVPNDRRAPLADTSMWARLGSDHGAAECAAVGAAPLREHVLTSFAALAAPVGPTHGDLHADNVMFVDRRPLLIDWNRYEPNNPLFLDSLYALVHEGQQRQGTGIGTELVAYADGRSGGPLRALVDQSLGDFTREQAALVLLLDRIVSYSESRARYKPWMLGGFAAAAATFAERLASHAGGSAVGE